MTPGLTACIIRVLDGEGIPSQLYDVGLERKMENTAYLPKASEQTESRGISNDDLSFINELSFGFAPYCGNEDPQPNYLPCHRKGV